MDLIEFFKYLSLFSGWCFIILGCLFIFSSAIGFFRMPDFFSRIHAVGISDSFGCPLVLIGITIFIGLNLASMKIILLVIFMLIIGPTATYNLANGAFSHGYTPTGNLKQEANDDEPTNIL